MSQGVWSIVLAGGEGRRLASLTVDASGHHRPKQFCSFGPGPTLLRRALDRAEAIASRGRVVPVVLEAHRQLWTRELAGLPEANIGVQPADRGTAPAILVALLAILEEDPAAHVVVFPSDHHVEREELFRRHLSETLRISSRRMVLIGAHPERVDEGFGWIRPAEVADSTLMRVAGFVEKPDRPVALRLASEGALVNTMILLAPAAALLELYRQNAPRAVELLAGSLSRPRRPTGSALAGAYQMLPSLDFSRHVLQSAAGRGPLWVTALPRCGWSDVGTIERLELVRRHLYRPLPDVSRIVAASRKLGSEYWLG